MDATAHVHRGAWWRCSVASGGARAAAGTDASDRRTGKFTSTTLTKILVQKLQQLGYRPRTGTCKSSIALQKGMMTNIPYWQNN